MKVIDIVENANDIDWLNDQIKDISQLTLRFKLEQLINTGLSYE